MSDTAAAPVDVGDDVDELASAVIALRRALHRYPELAFEEVRTGALLAAAMRALDLRVDERVGGTGVVATLDGARAGRTLLIRADMDALAMPDATARPIAVRIVSLAALDLLQ
jgi:amidohydrolase